MRDVLNRREIYVSPEVFPVICEQSGVVCSSLSFEDTGDAGENPILGDFDI